MQCTRALSNEKILEQRAVRANRLRPNAGAAVNQVVDAQFRNESLQRLAEQTPAERATKLVADHRRVSSKESPEPAKEQRVSRVTQIHIPGAVAFASELEHGVRAGFDAAADHPREVHPRNGNRDRGQDTRDGESTIVVPAAARSTLKRHDANVILRRRGSDSIAANRR
jgi:hypothetical protein